MKTLTLFWLSLALLVAVPTVRCAETPEGTPAPEKTPLVVPPAPSEPAVKAPVPDEKAASPSRGGQKKSRRELKVVFGETALPAGESVRGAKVVFGQARIDGTVEGNAEFVFSDVTINGTVKGDIKAVFSQVRLGPDAVVVGDVKSVFSQVQRHDGKQLSSGTKSWAAFDQPEVPESLYVWGEKAFCRGRPLAIDGRLAWLWWGVAALTALQLVLALLFPRAVDVCGRTLTEHPGATVLASLAVLLGTPVIFFLLLLTGVGLLLWPLLVVALLFAGIFGRTALQAALGRPVAALFGERALRHPVIAVAIGAVVLTGCYLLPFLGIVVWLVAGWLSLGMVACAVFFNLRSRQKSTPGAMPAGAKVEPAPLPIAPVVVVGQGDPSAPMPGVASASVATLPRAGFWLRFVASLVDAVIVGIVSGLVGGGASFPLLFAAYCVAMWALKGTTIGGVVLGLKVVRLDERKLDWSIALVRGLGGFLSLFVAGLGFFWVAFDPARQSWHDKIAGTTVVCMPKGVPLL